jgi:hypothetical protein
MTKVSSGSLTKIQSVQFLTNLDSLLPFCALKYVFQISKTIFKALRCSMYALTDHALSASALYSVMF